jgi:acetamidase/formamidase
MTRVQKRFLTLAIFTHRGRGATLERGDARSADGFGRDELDEVFATLASYNYALALDILKESALLWPVDVPEAEVMLVRAHLTPPPPQPTIV